MTLSFYQEQLNTVRGLLARKREDTFWTSALYQGMNGLSHSTRTVILKMARMLLSNNTYDGDRIVNLNLCWPVHFEFDQAEITREEEM